MQSLLIFGGSLFPVLGFFNVYPFRYSYVADHFQYLASVAIILPAAALLATLLEWGGLPLHRRGGQVLAAALVCGLGVLTWRQSRSYRSAETLYRATLARNPASYKEHHNLGRLLARGMPRMPEAISHYEAAIRIKPDHFLAHFSAGVALYTLGRTAEAVPHFRRVLELAPGNAYLAGTSHYFIGAILMADPQRWAEARRELEEAVRLRPDDLEARSRLVEVLARLRPGAR